MTLVRTDVERGLLTLCDTFSRCQKSTVGYPTTLYFWKSIRGDSVPARERIPSRHGDRRRSSFDVQRTGKGSIFFTRAHLMNNWQSTARLQEKRPICRAAWRVSATHTHTHTRLCSRPVLQQQAYYPVLPAIRCSYVAVRRWSSDQDTINMRADVNVEWVINRPIINIRQLHAVLGYRPMAACAACCPRTRHVVDL